MTEDERNLQRIRAITDKHDLHAKLGGEVFLGKNLRRAKVLHLGLNPGIPKWKQNELENKGNLEFESNLWDFNPLLEPDPSGAKIGDKYWKNAAIFFNANNHLAQVMQQAVFSFLIPWRSKDFAELKRRSDFPQILKHSKALLDEILNIVQPEIIMFSGKECARMFWRFYFDENFDQLKCNEGDQLSINQNHFLKVYRHRHHSVQTFVVLNHFSRTGNKLNSEYGKGNLEVLADELVKSLSVQAI